MYHRMRKFAYRDRRMHMGIPVCIRAGIAKKFAYGDPITHNEVVRIRGLTCTPGTAPRSKPVDDDDGSRNRGIIGGRKAGGNYYKTAADNCGNIGGRTCNNKPIAAVGNGGHGDGDVGRHGGGGTITIVKARPLLAAGVRT